MARFIHFSGLLNPGKSLPPVIGLAKNMNTEKKIIKVMCLARKFEKSNISKENYFLCNNKLIFHLIILR